MADNLVTKITTQTFSEAGGVDAHPDLEMGVVIANQLDGTYNYFHAVRNLNESLDRIAQSQGYTHVFGVKYEFVKAVSEGTLHDSLNRDDTVHRATGTGYKPRE